MDRFSDILQRLRGKYEAFGRRLDEAEAVERWESAVGPGIAKHTRALRVERSELWVEVDHPVWKSELLFQKAQILVKLNGKLPEETRVKDIIFLDPRPTGPSSKYGNGGGYSPFRRTSNKPESK